MLLKDVLGNLGTCTSVALACAPFLDDVPAIKKAGTTGDRSPIVFVAIWANAMLWINYGVAVNAFHPIATTNLVGGVSGTYFLFYFYNYAPPVAKSQFMKALLVAVSGVAAVYLYTYSSSSPPSTLQFQLGLVCFVITVALYASPLGAVARAARLRTNRFISLQFASIGLANATLWSAFGMLTSDPWVYGPNLLGMALSLVQLCAYFIFNEVKVATPDADREGLLSAMLPLDEHSEGNEARRRALSGGPRDKELA